MAFDCRLCQRSFETQRGLNIHSKRSHPADTIQSQLSAESIDNVESIQSTVDSVNPQDNGTTTTVDECSFMWGDLTSGQFSRDLNFVYEEIVYWRKNLFKLPSGSAGKDFIKETTRLLKAWTSKSALRPIAWKCIMAMPQLLLQKPSRESKAKDHVVALKRRLASWSRGNIMELYNEGKTIQSRMTQSRRTTSSEALSRKFSALMKAGKVSAAVKLITSKMSGSILQLNGEGFQLSQIKHLERNHLTLTT